MPVDPRITFECDWNYWRANAAIFGTSRIGGAAETHDVVLQQCGAPQPDFNTAFLKHPGGDLEPAMKTAGRYFAGLDLPYSFECRSREVDLCSDALAAAGFDRSRETPAMVLAPIQAEGKRVPGLEIETVEDPVALQAFQETAFEGFGLPGGAGPLFLSDQLHALPNTVFYLGRIDGAPVCTSMLIRTGNVAGIYWVATLEAHRGRGLGETITAAAVAGGRALGCRFASLQASVAGEPVYRRMGFEVHGHYVRFERPPAPGEP